MIHGDKYLLIPTDELPNIEANTQLESRGPLGQAALYEQALHRILNSSKVPTDVQLKNFTTKDQQYREFKKNLSRPVRIKVEEEGPPIPQPMPSQKSQEEPEMATPKAEAKEEKEEEEQPRSSFHSPMTSPGHNAIQNIPLKLRDQAENVQKALLADSSIRVNPETGDVEFRNRSLGMDMDQLIDNLMRKKK